MIDTHEKLMKKIMILNDRVWEKRIPRTKVEKWLENFTGKFADVDKERLHALYWLSQFMYFGSREIRVLLKSLYRDLYLRPMIQDIRATSPKGITDADLKTAVEDELAHTRFFGVGNPSESGVHLLYYFRQENVLGKSAFMDAVQIFTRTQTSSSKILRKPDVRRYVFLDDICGSGDTAIDYSSEVLKDLLALNPEAKAAYYCLFATSDGLKNVQQKSLFGKNCGAVYELDKSYRCLSVESRYFNSDQYPLIDKVLACELVNEYGKLLNPKYATGWKDSQMLMGFHHNTPDNTIGMIWADSVWGCSIPWAPIFKRYPKDPG
jgi:hypothetical protein